MTSPGEETNQGENYSRGETIDQKKVLGKQFNGGNGGKKYSNKFQT